MWRIEYVRLDARLLPPRLSFVHLDCLTLHIEPLALGKSNVGDPDWIRTNNLPLRRGLLYPVEPQGRVAKLFRLSQKGKRKTCACVELPVHDLDELCDRY